jgi:hypothetical protein
MSNIGIMICCIKIEIKTRYKIRIAGKGSASFSSWYLPKEHHPSLKLELTLTLAIQRQI